jgi:hypothetical protein
VGNPNITYRSRDREDASAESERALLGAAYAYLLTKRMNVEPAPEPDVRDGTQVQGDDSADEGSIPE